MSPVVTMDLRGFNESVARLRSVNKRETTDFLRRLAVELLKYLVRLTPPSGGHAFTETFGTQKKAGEQAVRGDITKGFESLNKLAMMRTPTGRLGRRLKQVIRDGRPALASHILRNAGGIIRSSGIIDEVTPHIHHRLRNRRGRITTDDPFLVIKQSSITQRIKNVQKRVGYAKAGWGEAMKGLRVFSKYPKWITQHNTPGTFMESGVFSLKYTIRMQNRVKYGLRFYTSIVPAALRKLKGSVEAQFVALINRRHKRKI